MDEISGQKLLDHGSEVDSRTLVPDICRETRRAVIDVIRGEQPTTVLGYLMQNRTKALEVETIAQALGKSVEEIEWTTEVLEEEELCVRLMDEPSTKVVAVAPYSVRNQ